MGPEIELKIKIERDCVAIPGEEFISFISPINGGKIARIWTDSENAGKYCAMLGNLFEARRGLELLDAERFVRTAISAELHKYGICAEFEEEESAEC